MIIDGKVIAQDIYATLAKRVVSCSTTPSLAVVSLSQSTVTTQYLGIKKRASERVGIAFELVALPSDTNEEVVCEKIDALATSGRHHGIVVQLPLPASISQDTVLSHIPQAADVDALRPDSMSLYESGTGYTSPVVLAVEHIFALHNVSLQDKRVVVVGRGKLVGAPIVSWLRVNGADPVVLGRDGVLEDTLRTADVVIAGVGSPHMIVPEMIKDGAVLVDAGTSEFGGAVAGDFDPLCAKKASLFTPVPGGIGPITVAMLLQNVVSAAGC